MIMVVVTMTYIARSHERGFCRGVETKFKAEDSTRAALQLMEPILFQLIVEIGLALKHCAYNCSEWLFAITASL